MIGVADWVSIRADYVSGGGSLRVLAEKYGISVSSIKKKAASEGWTANRTKIEPRLYQKTVRKVLEHKSDQAADRLTRILTLGDTLLEKAERAAKELDQHLVTNKKRERTITYGDPNAYGKPTKEVIDDTEVIAVVEAPIDRMGVKQLASALKDLNDVVKVADTGNDASLTKARELLGGLPSAID